MNIKQALLLLTLPLTLLGPSSFAITNEGVRTSLQKLIFHPGISEPENQRLAVRGHPSTFVTKSINFGDIIFSDNVINSSYGSQFQFSLHLQPRKFPDEPPKVSIALRRQAWQNEELLDLKIRALASTLKKLRRYHQDNTLALYEQVLASRESVIYKHSLMRIEKIALEELKSQLQDPVEIAKVDSWLQTTRKMVEVYEGRSLKELAKIKEQQNTAINTDELEQLVANDDRKGAANYIESRLPWDAMTPVARAVWRNFLEAVVEPKNEYRVLLYRGDTAHVFVEKSKSSFWDKITPSPSGQLPKFFQHLQDGSKHDLAAPESFLLDEHAYVNQGSKGRITNSIITQLMRHTHYNQYGPTSSPMISLTERIDFAHSFALDPEAGIREGWLRAFAVDARLLLPEKFQNFKNDEQAYETLMLFPSDNILTKKTRLGKGAGARLTNFKALAERSFTEKFGPLDDRQRLFDHVLSPAAMNKFLLEALHFDRPTKITGSCKQVLGSTKP